MGIERSDPADGPTDAHIARRVRSATDDPDAAGKISGAPTGGHSHPDASPAHSDAVLRTQRAVAYCSKVDAVNRRYDVDPGYDRGGDSEPESVKSATHRIAAEEPGTHPLSLDDRPGGKTQLPGTRDSERLETRQPPGGDVPDDPRNYSNPKTGRVDASWSAYDRAIVAAREHSGGELGPDAIKMYDYNPGTGEGTGTLIGEQTPDRLRGWRIDGQDGHVNWWDWTGGKKGAGGVYGHDWFPEDPSVPGSRYIGWAPWQDSNGNILEGN